MRSRRAGADDSSPSRKVMPGTSAQHEQVGRARRRRDRPGRRAGRRRWPRPRRGRRCRRGGRRGSSARRRPRTSACSVPPWTVTLWRALGLHLRRALHVPGVGPDVVREQVDGRGLVAGEGGITVRSLTQSGRNCVAVLEAATVEDLGVGHRQPERRQGDALAVDRHHLGAGRPGAGGAFLLVDLHLLQAGCHRRASAFEVHEVVAELTDAAALGRVAQVLVEREQQSGAKQALDEQVEVVVGEGPLAEPLGLVGARLAGRAAAGEGGGGGQLAGVEAELGDALVVDEVEPGLGHTQGHRVEQHVAGVGVGIGPPVVGRPDGVGRSGAHRAGLTEGALEAVEDRRLGIGHPGNRRGAGQHRHPVQLGQVDADGGLVSDGPQEAAVAVGVASGGEQEGSIGVDEDSQRRSGLGLVVIRHRHGTPW